MTSRDAWVATFFAVVLAVPLLRLLSVERQSLGQELITVTGLLAVALLVVTVLLPARLRSVTKAFGIESVLSNHRVLGLATIVMILVHLGAVIVHDPTQVSLVVPFLNPLQSPTALVGHALLEPLLTPPVRSLTGLLATSAVVALGLLAAYPRGRYEVWRVWHLLLTIAVLGNTAAHIILINHLVPSANIVNALYGDPLGWPLLKDKVTDLPSLLYLAALALAVLLITLRRWLITPLSCQGRYRVVDVAHVTRSVSTISVLPEGRYPPTYEPGQFAWLRLGRSPLHEEHPFTVSSSVQDRPMIEFTIRHRGDFTNHMRTLLKGGEVWLDGPHGSFTVEEQSRGGIVMICRGVGITPMMAILRSMARSRSGRRRGRSIRLILADPPGTTLFREDIGALRADLNLRIYEMGDRELTKPRLEAMLPARFMRARLDYYVCGPSTLVLDMINVLPALGVPQDRVHTERFDA